MKHDQYAPFTPEQLASERRIALLIATGFFTAMALAFGIFIWVLEGEQIAERFTNQLYQEEQV